MSSPSRRIVLLSVAVILLAIVTPLSGVAHAAGPPPTVAWTQTLQGKSGQVDPNAAILTQPDGDVTFGGCTEYDPTQAIETWTSAGQLVASRLNTASPAPQMCDGDSAVNAQGDTYSIQLDVAANAMYMMGFQPNGTNLWTAPVPLPSTCGGNVLSVGYSTPVVGADGNIYGLVYYSQGDVCPTAVKLYGFNYQTGSLLFADTLNPDGRGDVSAYTGGLVVRSDNEVTYYSYSGSIIGGPYSMGGDQMDTDQGVAATTAGTAFVATGKTTAPTSSCSLTYTLNAIEAYQPSGRLWRTSIAGCYTDVSLNPMPDGGVAILASNYATNPVSSDILRYSSTGTLLWTLPASDIQVDTNGNVITETSYRRDDSTDPAFNNEPEFRIDVYNGVTGAVAYDFDTINFGTNDSYLLPLADIGLNQGRLYLGMASCAGNVTLGSGSCNNPPLLYAISAPVVGMDYPRGALLGVMSKSPNDLARCPVVKSDKQIDQLDAADVTAPSDMPFDGVSAELSQAANCVDTGTSKSSQWVYGPDSSWVMLQSRPVQYYFAQAGILYHPNGVGSSDTMFGEIQTPTLGIPDQTLVDSTARFGPVTIRGLTITLNNEPVYDIQVAFGNAISSGYFGVSILANPATTDVQCKGEPSDNTPGYANVQGAKPSMASPADVVKLTYGGDCLWEFFVPPSDASQLTLADVAAEIHSTGSHLPGTTVQPLVFNEATTIVDRDTGWFADPPSQTVKYPKTNEPCNSSTGTQGSYLFAVWSGGKTDGCG